MHVGIVISLSKSEEVMIWRRIAIGLVSIVLTVPTIASAAQLLIHYDVDNLASWNGSQLLDLQGFSTPLTPDDGTPRNDTGPAFVPGDFGAPVYQSSGAVTSVSAPWLVTRNRAECEQAGVVVVNPYEEHA